MININRTTPRRLDVVASGTLDEIAVSAAADELESALKEGIALLLDLREFDDITARGLARDLAEGMRLFGRLARCRRIAVVADQRWLRAASRVDGAFLPDVEVRTFSVDQIVEARAWLDDDGGISVDTIDPETAARPAIQLVEGTRPGLLEMVIDGYLDDDDVKRVMPAFERALDSDTPLDMLTRIESFRGFDPELLTDRNTWKLKRKGMKRLRRYAVITSIGWLDSAVTLADKLVSAEMQVFTPDEEAAARAWLDEGVASV